MNAKANFAGPLSNAVVFVVLLIDAVLLAWAQLIFLPLRVADFWSAVPPGWNLPLPVSIVVALVSTPWLVFAAARVSTRLSVMATPALLWLLAVIVFGVAGPGGDVLLANDWRALTLLGLGSLAGATALSTRLAIRV